MRPILALLLLVALAGAAVPVGKPADVGMDAERFAAIDKAVNAAIKEGKAPGAVVLVLRSSKVVFRKAYGSCAVAPVDEAMTLDTIFDMASLTKPIATATSVIMLAKQGKLHLEDAVAKHLPAFTGGGKESVTLRICCCIPVACRREIRWRTTRRDARPRSIASAPCRSSLCPMSGSCIPIWATSCWVRWSRRSAGRPWMPLPNSISLCPWE